MLHYFLYPFLFFTHLFCPGTGNGNPNAIEMKQVAGSRFAEKQQAYDVAALEAKVGLMTANATKTDGGTFVQQDAHDLSQKSCRPSCGNCVCILATGFFTTLTTLTVWALVEGMAHQG